MKNKIFSWVIKLGIIAAIGFTLFCLGRVLNHFPKHEAEVSTTFPVSPQLSVTIPIYEATKTDRNSYEILRRAQ